jgi:hypothetical protein
LKGAETDATKRALATFGNPFGLALYDREQSGVRKARGTSRGQENDKQQLGPWVLRSSAGKPVSSHEASASFIDALKRTMSEAQDIEFLYDLWEANIETLRAVHRSAPEQPGVVPTMVKHLRACAVELVRRASNGGAPHLPKGNGASPHKIDKSVLAIREPRRIRSKEHLRFVASQPCLICGRTPSHAHHVRYAQTRGLSLKVSDEFTVPLCAIHHNQIHTTGKEREWWQERHMDPLKVATALWQQSRDTLSTAADMDVVEEALSTSLQSRQEAEANDQAEVEMSPQAAVQSPTDSSSVVKGRN